MALLCISQVWPWIQSAGVDSGRILHFFWNWSWSQKFLKNKTWIKGQFIFSAAAGVCVVFINVIGNAQIGLHHVQSFSTERH